MLPLLLAACSPADPPTDGEHDTGAAISDDAAFVGPDPVEGGTLVAWGRGGLYVLDAGAFRKLADLDLASVVTTVNASGGTITLVEDCVATVVDVASGATVVSHAFDCDADAWLSDALYREGVLYGAFGAAANVVRVEADDTETPLPSAWADRFQSDQGRMYLQSSLGREGTALTPVDATSLDATGEVRLTGFAAEARGDSVYAWYGEEGDSRSGGYILDLWADPAADLGVVLSEGKFVDAIDAVYGRATLARLVDYPGWAMSGALLDASGGVVDGFDTCFSPRLVWHADALDGWCADPLRRYTWTWDGATWIRADEQDFDEDVQNLQLVEPGD